LTAPAGATRAIVDAPGQIGELGQAAGGLG